MKFFTSDHHFGHTNIIKYCSRPFSNTVEMEQTLIENWNKTVSSSDTVYVVGDFSFLSEDKSKELLSKLNGTKILIKGNHDRSKDKMLAMGFSEVYDQTMIEIGGQKVLLHHYPYRPKSMGLNPLPKHFNRRPKDSGHWLVHGHVHDCWQQLGKMINVSVEVWNYLPVSETEILGLMGNGSNNLKVNEEKVKLDSNY